MPNPPRILAIDTSCDDTSIAVLEGERVLANIVSSQINIHKAWGGVVPMLARREHERVIDDVIALAVKRAKLDGIEDVQAIAVTYGPGLSPALEVGVAKAKQLATVYDKKLIAVDHMEGHTLSALLRSRTGRPYSGLDQLELPFMAVCVSGGHTELIWSEKLGTYEILGQTLDDAAGEAFDKVARMLDLGYPGGPAIAKLAQEGDPEAYTLPRPMHSAQNNHFSFSGLKTHCLYETNNLKEELKEQFAQEIPNYCASFQEAVVDSLLNKIKRVLKERTPKMVLLGGGVSANNRLRSKLRKELKKRDIPLYAPAKQFCMDNAAMIGLAAYYKYERGEFVETIADLDRDPSITIDKRKY